MDVRLGELPVWLATRNFSPQGLLGGLQKGEAKFPALEAELLTQFTYYSLVPVANLDKEVNK